MRERLVTLQDLIVFFLSELDQQFFSRSFIGDTKPHFIKIAAILEKEFSKELYGETADDLIRICREHTQFVKHKLSELVHNRNLMNNQTDIVAYSCACTANTLLGSLVKLYAQIIVHLGRIHDVVAQVHIEHSTLTCVISPTYMGKLSLR